LSEYYLASGKPEALELGEQALSTVMEAKSHTKRRGYWND